MHDLVLNCAMQFFHVSTQEEYHFTMFYNATILSFFYTRRISFYYVLQCNNSFMFLHTRRISFYYVLQCNNSFIFLHKKNIILLCSTMQQFFHFSTQEEHHFTMFYNPILSCSVKRTSFYYVLQCKFFSYSAKRTSFTMFCMFCTIYNKQHC